MAASAATASSSSGLCPNYAVICSFLERYGALLDLPELTFPQLERYLQDTSSVPKLLADLHVKLLRKIGKSVSADRWEKYLVKICQEVNATWAWELEQKGYKELPVECKTAILKYLCECQFDENVKFKTAINDEDPDKMRVQPIGRDKDGQMYWFQLDQDNNVRVYLEEQDDLDGSSWKCIVRTRNDLAEVVALLKTQIDPELLKRDLELKNKTDGGEDKEKAEGDTKNTEDTSEEEGKDSNKTVCSETNELTQKDELKSEDSEAKSTLNGIVEGKPEAELDSENVSTKALNIKEEQMEETDIKPNSTEPTPSYETSCVSLKEEKVEVKKNSSEQIQHAMKNDQQAKIPLKKRGMKFSEGFEKNGAITAQNPSVTNLKEAPEAESNSEPPQKIQRVNDQVNGEVQPPSEKEPLKEAAADKEQTNKSRENAVSAANEDGLQEKKSDMCSIETLKEAKSPQSDSKRIEDVQEEKETEKRESHKSSQSSREPTTARKDNNNGVEKSSNHEKLESITKITESKSDGDGTSTEKKTNSVKETDKTNSENLNSNHEVKSKEVDSEVKSSCVDIDTSESKQITDSTKTETSDSNADKSDSSAPKEKRESTKTDTQFAEKGPPEKSVDSKVIVSPSVIKKSDKPVISDKSEETVNIKKGVEPPAVTKKSESSKPDEKSDKIIENSSKACETEKENSEGVKKINNCDDHSIDVTTIKDSTSRSITEETLDGKDNLAKPQGDNKIDITSVERKTADDACEGKDKPSGPVEKTKTCEETDEKSQRLKKEEEKMSEKDSKETSEEHPSESIKDAAEDNKNLPNDKRKEDSSTDEVLKSETKEDKKPKKQRKASTDKDESELKKSSKEPDVESSKEAEKQPSKEAATDEQSKNKTKEVENGTEASSEEGVRRKNRLPIHRRRAELQREERQGDSESDTNTGRCLRRSPRISKPTQKAVEIQDKKTEKSPADPLPQKHKDDKNEKEEEEVEEEETEVKTVQKKPKEKKADQESQPKPKGRKRRRTRWSNTRTRRKKKDSEDEDDNSDEESSEEEESEEEDDSDEDYKVERSRKRRNRNRERRSSDSSTSSDDDLPPNDDPCKHCGLPNHPELILLCDSCDNGYHTACLRPPLMIIPDGEWFCPPCQHKQLCDKLEEQLQNLDSALKKKERAERRKERLIYVGISVENIIAPSVEVEEEKPEIIIKEKKEAKRSKSWGRRSTRAKKTISYRFDEFDEAIEEAIEEDIKEAEGGGAGRGKDMANITGLRGKDISTILQAEEGKENGRPPRPSAAQRKKKRRRLNDLDSDSTVDEEESEDEFCLSESSEEEFVASDNDSEPETEQDSNDSNFGSNKSSKHHSSSRTRRPQKLRQSSRKRQRPKWYSDDEEEETDDEVEEDEMVTEGSSDFSDSDLDMSRRRSRRSLKKAVNYCETSESEGSQAETNRAKMKPRRRQESSESDASFSRDSEEDSKDRREKRRVDSSEEDSRQRRRRLALKRRRASEEDDSDDDSDESSEEDRPIRKRVNRIDSDDDDEEEQEENPKEKKSTEEESKGTNPSDCSMVELQPANGQSEMKSFEGFISRPAPAAPGLVSHLEPPKNISSTPAAAIAPNGLAGQEGTAQDDDEDDLLGVTDLVDYVCNNEQL